MFSTSGVLMHAAGFFRGAMQGCADSGTDLFIGSLNTLASPKRRSGLFKTRLG